MQNHTKSWCLRSFLLALKRVAGSRAWSAKTTRENKVAEFLCDNKQLALIKVAACK